MDQCAQREWVGRGGGLYGNRVCQLASRSVLKDFTDDALTISAGSLFGPNAENALVPVGSWNV